MCPETAYLLIVDVPTSFQLVDRQPRVFRLNDQALCGIHRFQRVTPTKAETSPNDSPRQEGIKPKVWINPCLVFLSFLPAVSFCEQKLVWL